MLVIVREEKQVLLTWLPDSEGNGDPAQPVNSASRLCVENIHRSMLDSLCALEIPNWKIREHWEELPISPSTFPSCCSSQSGAGSPRHHNHQAQGAGRMGFCECTGLQFERHGPCFCPQRPLSGHFSWPWSHQEGGHSSSCLGPGLSSALAWITPRRAGRKARTAAGSKRHTRVYRAAPVTKHSTITPTDGQSLNYRMVCEEETLKIVQFQFPAVGKLL